MERAEETELTTGDVGDVKGGEEEMLSQRGFGHGLWFPARRRCCWAALALDRDRSIRLDSGPGFLLA